MTFVATKNTGFAMTFDNGFTISVQWGTFNYCEKKNLSADIDEEMKTKRWESRTAEIAVFDKDRKIVPVGKSDDVIGWCSADEVAKYITIVQSTTAGNTEELEEKFKELKI